MAYYASSDSDFFLRSSLGSRPARLPVHSAPSRFARLVNCALVSLFLLSCSALSAQTQVNVGYEFARGKLTELSGMKTTLAVPAFADERDVAAPQTLFTGNLADGGAVLAERALGEIIGDGLRGGFAASNARLENEGAGMRLAGTITGTEAALVDRGGVESLQFTLRTSIQLVEGTRIVWQTKLFGRGTVPASEGTAAAVGKAIDRLIEELLIDDYFLAEIR